MAIRAFEGTYETGCGESECKPPAPSVMPIYEYSHEVGCAVIGGQVYRGIAAPQWQGSYIFGDLCSGAFTALNRDADGVWFRHLLGAKPGFKNSDVRRRSQRQKCTVAHTVTRCPSTILSCPNCRPSSRNTMSQWRYDVIVIGKRPQWPDQCRISRQSPGLKTLGVGKRHTVGGATIPRCCPASNFPCFPT